MSWEALRLTSRAPSELHKVLGPHGVDELIRHALSTCWREHPAESRSLPAVQKVVREVFDRNLRVWSAIKKPSPQAFFDDLLPHAADGFIRQALVLCWMMLPRGRKSIQIVRDVVTSIFVRNMQGWEEDERTFTAGPARKPPSAKATGKASLKKTTGAKAPRKAGKPLSSPKARPRKTRK